MQRGDECISKSNKNEWCFDVLDNLQRIASVFGYIDDALSELKSLALSIIPEVARLISALNIELKNLQRELDSEKYKLKTLQKKEAFYVPILEKKYLENDATSYEDKKMIEMQFRKENKEYDEIKSAISNLQASIWKKEAFITARKNFRDNLAQQKELIISQSQKIVNQ